jgi:hypothetical protein
MDVLTLVLIMAIPAIGLVVLGVVMNRWGRKNDPMGGEPGDVLPIGRAHRPYGSRD